MRTGVDHEHSGLTRGSDRVERCADPLQLTRRTARFSRPRDPEGRAPLGVCTVQFARGSARNREARLVQAPVAHAVARPIAQDSLIQPDRPTHGGTGSGSDRSIIASASDRLRSQTSRSWASACPCAAPRAARSRLLADSWDAKGGIGEHDRMARVGLLRGPLTFPHVEDGDRARITLRRRDRGLVELSPSRAPGRTDHCRGQLVVPPATAASSPADRYAPSG
jgi:hypothetical protein